MFAGYLNSLNSSLQLNGRHCSQRFTTYKKKYLATQLWANNTGAGLTEQEMGMTLQQKLDVLCPCSSQMNAIFGSKANGEAFSELNKTSVGTIMVDSGSESNSDEEHKTMSDSCMSEEEMKTRKSTKNNIRNPQMHEALWNSPNTTTTSDLCSERVSKKKNVTHFPKWARLNMKDANEQQDKEFHCSCLKIIKNYFTLQEKKWVANLEFKRELSTQDYNFLKENSDCKYMLDKEKMDQQMLLEQK
ncbi:hypothetical protein O181_082966 [Austropuccinia psidii MF-1]|uniref:Uncharacterized protein n=1 Tax=Austropuccinia psidii MF-1 TaxID=1389203 RepID=A0A9Q3IHG7_9BASI|nr:hypothetical protein [Austropuccinia psidii MF-1]